MAFVRFAHSDDRGLAFPGEAYSHQVHPFVSAIDLAAQHLLESFAAQGVERGPALLVLKPLFGRAVEPLQRASAVIGLHRAKERSHYVLGSGRWLLRASEKQSSQSPERNARR